MPLVGDPTIAIGGAKLEELWALAFEVEVRVRLELAEVAAECEVFVSGEMLIGEQQHEVLEQEFVDHSGVVAVGVPERDAADLGAE